jgi:CrcB protein
VTQSVQRSRLARARLRARRRVERRRTLATVGVVAIGGAVGAVCRYLAGVAWPTGHGTFPVTTFGVNVVGCALIGVFLVLVTDVWTPRPLLRPYIATGKLGGFKTIYTNAVDSHGQRTSGTPVLGLVYLVATPVAALVAVWVAAAGTRWLVTRRLT